MNRQNISEIVAGRLKQFIIDNGLKPGDRLPTEQELADRFGVSRVSLREATKALSFLGIIRSAPRRGLTVGQIDMKRVTEYLGFHLALTDYPNAELLQARIVIETGALVQLMERMQADPQLYAQLHGAAKRLQQLSDPVERIEGDVAFHRALLEASGIAPLVAFNDLLQIFFNRFRQAFLDGQWEIGAQMHVDIVDALRDGKLEVAQTTMLAHLEYYKPAA